MHIQLKISLIIWKFSLLTSSSYKQQIKQNKLKERKHLKKRNKLTPQGNMTETTTTSPITHVQLLHMLPQKLFSPSLASQELCPLVCIITNLLHSRKLNRAAYFLVLLFFPKHYSEWPTIGYAFGMHILSLKIIELLLVHNINKFAGAYSR